MGENISIDVEKFCEIYRLYKEPKDRMKEIFMPGKNVFHKGFVALSNISFNVKKKRYLGL